MIKVCSWDRQAAGTQSVHVDVPVRSYTHPRGKIGEDGPSSPHVILQYASVSKSITILWGSTVSASTP